MAAQHALSIGIILDSCFDNLRLSCDDGFGASVRLGYGFDKVWELDDLLNIQTLRACMLVNQTWFKHASEVFWCNPFPEALTEVTLARRQLYADKIRSLWIAEMDNEILVYNDQTRCLKFPRLEKLSVIKQFNTENFTVPSAFLQPRLRLIHIHCDWVDKDLLIDGLINRCHGLRQMQLGFPTDRVPTMNEKDLLRLLNGLPNLNSLVLGIGWDNAITREVVTNLASYPNLEKLVLGSPFNRGNIAGFESLSNPFRTLSTLRASCPSDLLPILIKYIPSVTKLRLVVTGTARTLHSISRLTQLQELEIRLGWLSESWIDPQDVLQLFESLHHIQAFTVGAKNCQPPHDWLKQVAKEKPLLKELHIPYADFKLNGLTPGFQSASRLQVLEVWHIGVNYSATSQEDLPSETVHFVVLESLRLFPNLESLVIGSYGDLQVAFDILRQRVLTTGCEIVRMDLTAPDPPEWVTQLREGEESRG